MAQENLSVYPASYRDLVGTANSSYPLSNAVGKSSSNTTYAQWNMPTGSGAESYVFYKFDLSQIPAGAVIDSISCTATGLISSTSSSYIAARQMQLYTLNGTTWTAKGTAVTLKASPTTFYLKDGSWTREELEECYIRIYAKRGTSNTSTMRFLRFYGATLTVTYTESGQQFLLKTGGEWKQAVVYKKISGSWQEQTAYEELFPAGSVWQGIAYEAQDVYLTGSISVSSATNINLTGVDFTPIYVFCFAPAVGQSSGTYYQGMISTVPKSGSNYGGALENDYPSSVDATTGQNIYSGTTLTLKAVNTGVATLRFSGGTYYYTIIGSESDNLLYGTMTLSAASATLAINIGTGKSVLDVKLYYDSSDPGVNCSYAVNNGTVYGGTYDSEYAIYNIVSTSKSYSVSGGVLTLNAYSTSYKFQRGIYYYCLVLE